MRRRGRRRPRARVEDLDAAILEYLSAHPTRSFKAKELQRALRVPQSQYRDLRRRIRELAREGRVASLPRRRVGALEGATRVEGVVEGIGHSATHVRLGDDERLPLVDRSVEQVVPGDRVRIRRVREAGRTLALVDRLLLACEREVFGTLQRHGSHWVLEPDPPIPSLRGGVFLEEGQDLSREVEGQLARGRLPVFDPSVERPRLASVEVLGPADHPRAAMLGRITAAGWPREFSPRAREEAGVEVELEPARRDLEDDFVFTIDPLDAKDHDDAVGIERTDDGGWVLSVHIADVAHRVRSGGALDDEALLRATSVYPPGMVLPMLPEVLSAGACSLHHTGARDTVSVRIHYGADGQRHHLELGLATIRSRASLAYEHAEAFLDAERPESVDVPRNRLADDVELEQLSQAVRSMHELAGRLRQRRRELGSLFVDRPEREFRFREDGHVESVQVRPSLRSHWIIEEFMLEANRAVAEVLQAADLPLLWRVHEEPDERKIDALVEFLRPLGIRWSPAEPVSGHDFADLFARVEGRPESPLIQLLALRSLMKAQYRAGWKGHFGLAFERYTHFTSPIRRYPDLHNQRCLHRMIQSVGDGGWLDDARAGARNMARARITRPADRKDAEMLADRCSDLERQAQLLERDCADICAADALKPLEGEELEGMIVTVTPSGLFVEIDDFGLDGFVGVAQLGQDWFYHDPQRHAQVGERTGRIFRIGQRVRVLLEYVDVGQGRLWLGSIRHLEKRVEGRGRNRE